MMSSKSSSGMTMNGSFLSSLMTATGIMPLGQVVTAVSRAVLMGGFLPTLHSICSGPAVTSGHSSAPPLIWKPLLTLSSPRALKRLTTSRSHLAPFCRCILPMLFPCWFMCGTCSAHMGTIP